MSHIAYFPLNGWLDIQTKKHSQCASTKPAVWTTRGPRPHTYFLQSTQGSQCFSAPSEAGFLKYRCLLALRAKLLRCSDIIMIQKSFQKDGVSLGRYVLWRAVARQS